MSALVLNGTAYYASRSQLFINDELCMKGMIPHHSIAILTSERANLDDVRVRRLADEIILTQRREIAEMKWLLQQIEENGPATTEAEPRTDRCRSSTPQRAASRQSLRTACPGTSRQ